MTAARAPEVPKSSPRYRGPQGRAAAIAVRAARVPVPRWRCGQRPGARPVTEVLWQTPRPRAEHSSVRCCGCSASPPGISYCMLALQCQTLLFQDSMLHVLCLIMRPIVVSRWATQRASSIHIALHKASDACILCLSALSIDLEAEYYAEYYPEYYADSAHASSSSLEYCKLQTSHVLDRFAYEHGRILKLISCY